MRVPSEVPLNHVLSFPLELSTGNTLTRVEYRYSRSDAPAGAWRHAGDYASGKRNVDVHGRDLPKDLKPGEKLRVDFRAYNGESYSPEVASADIAVNTRPSITRDTSDTGPLTFEAEQPLTLPFSISDEDGDALTVLFRIDDDVTWSVVPTSPEPNVIPAELVARAFAAPGIHTVAVTAFDGLEDSAAPVVYEVGYSLPERDLPIKQLGGRQFEVDVSQLGGVPVKLYYQIHDWGRERWGGPISIAKHIRGQTVQFTEKELDDTALGQHSVRCRYEVPDGNFITRWHSWIRWPNFRLDQDAP
jgi:hypothetical protein